MAASARQNAVSRYAWILSYYAPDITVQVARTMSGQYDFGLLAVDVHGTGDRIVLNGDAARELSGNVKGLK